MWKEIARWWANQATVDLLRGFDDRMLQDMGLTREDIRDRVAGRGGVPQARRPRWRRPVVSPFPR